MDGVQASAHVPEGVDNSRESDTDLLECRLVHRRECVKEGPARARELHQRSGYIWQDSDDGLGAKRPCAATHMSTSLMCD